MTDYSNYRKWKEVELHSCQEYLQEHIEYSPEDVLKLCQELIEKGEMEGLEGCFLKFQSTREPYEDWLGEPVVTVVGYREYTEEEKQALREEDAIRALAKELNITEYEARIVKKLKDNGVV